MNRAYLTVKKGENIFYGDYKIMGQVMPAANPPTDISKHEWDEDKVMIVEPLYDLKQGTLRAFRKQLASSVSVGIPLNVSLNYRYHEKNSKVLYAY